MAELFEATSERLSYKLYSSAVIDPSTAAVSASDPATSGGQILRHVSHSFSLAKDMYTEDEVRTDKQRPMEKHGTRRVQASINGLLSTLTQSDLFEAALGGDWSGSAITSDQATLTSAAADNATSKFTFAGGDPVAAGFRVGDIVRFGGLSDTDNNSRNFVALAFGGTSNREMTVYPAPDSMSADTSFTITTVGRSLFMPASAHVKRKLAFEVYNSDGDIARLFTEGRIAGFELQAAPNQNARVNFNGLWRDREVYDGGNAPFFASPTAETTTEVISSMDGLLRMNGQTAAIVTGLNITFNRAPTAPAQIHSAGLTAGILLANAVVTGDFTVFLQDRTFLDAFDDATEFELLAYFPDSQANTAGAVVFYLPRIKINSNTETTVDGAKALQCGFTAARYFGSAPGVVSSVMRIVDTAVT